MMAICHWCHSPVIVFASAEVSTRLSLGMSPVWPHCGCGKMVEYFTYVMPKNGKHCFDKSIAITYVFHNVWTCWNSSSLQGICLPWSALNNNSYLHLVVTSLKVRPLFHWPEDVHQCVYRTVFCWLISASCSFLTDLLTDVQAQLEKLQNEIAQAAKKTGIASAAKLATIQPKKDIVSKTYLSCVQCIFVCAVFFCFVLK